MPQTLILQIILDMILKLYAKTLKLKNFYATFAAEVVFQIIYQKSESCLADFGRRMTAGVQE